MLNIDEFNKRLEFLLEYYGVSASIFADRIGIQRSGMSHLVSGRNKPSLDFVMKIVDSFPEVDLYWLLSGKGEFPKNEEGANLAPEPVTKEPVIKNEAKNEIFSDTHFSEPKEKQTEKNENTEPNLFSLPENNERTKPIEATKEIIKGEPALRANPQQDATGTVKDILPVTEGDIDRIVIFYRNGSFKSYTPTN